MVQSIIFISKSSKIRKNNRMAQGKTTTKTGTIEKTEFKIKPAKSFQVVIHNNPITAFEAVMDVLTTVFKKTDEESFAIMLEAHNRQKSTVQKGLSRDMANLKVQESKEFCEQKDSSYFQNGEHRYRGNYKYLEFTVEEENV